MAASIRTDSREHPMAERLSPELLSNIFGWAAVVVPLIAAGIGLFRNAPKWTVAGAAAVAVIAGGAQYFRSTVTGDLRTEIAVLKANRWEPLSASESTALRSHLRGMPAPSQTFQVLCVLQGCGDLAESIRQAFQIPQWKVAIVPAYANETPHGIELWFRDDTARGIADALERATNGRLKISLRKFQQPDDHGQINLAIGHKP
jgi:hypothetical protein